MCNLCNEAVQEGTPRYPCCKVAVCKSCWEDWEKEQKTCPFCRANLRDLGVACLAAMPILSCAMLRFTPRALLALGRSLPKSTAGWGRQ